MTLDRVYAQALLEAQKGKSASEHAVIARNFAAYIKSKGHEQLLPKIAKRFQEAVKAEEKAHHVTIRVGHEKALTGEKEKLIEEIKKIFGDDVAVETRVDENLIGGYIVEGKDKRIDRSFKTGLTDLYKKMIHA